MPVAFRFSRATLPLNCATSRSPLQLAVEVVGGVFDEAVARRADDDERLAAGARMRHADALLGQPRLVRGELARVDQEAVGDVHRRPAPAPRCRDGVDRERRVRVAAVVVGGPGLVLVGAGRVRVAVVPALLDEEQRLAARGAAVDDLVGRLAVDDRRVAAEARVRAVVDGVEPPVLGHHQVVGVAEAGGVDRDRRVGRQYRLVQPVAAAPGAGDIHARGVLADAVVRRVRVVERRQVVDVLAAVVQPGAGVGLHRQRIERRQVDREDRGRKRVFGGVGEEARRRAVVGVAADREVERLAVGRERHAVRRVVLLRARQAADQVDRVPARAVPGQLGQHARVGVEVRVRVGGDARVARGGVDHRVLGGAGDEHAGQLPRLRRPGKSSRRRRCGSGCS